MKKSLHARLIITYILFAFLSFATVIILSSGFILIHLRDAKAKSLYKEAAYLSSEYISQYYEDASTLDTIYEQLKGIDTYLGCETWLVGPKGKVLINTSEKLSEQGSDSIKGFDPASSGSAYFQVGNFYEKFDKDMLSVTAPITSGFTTQGYLILHAPMNDIYEENDAILNYVYITVGIIIFYSFGIFYFIRKRIFRPLREITKATREYASGNFNYQIPVSHEDEMGTLSNSLNYMSKRLSEIEEDQKKFIANVSHDFRSPLTSIKGYAEAILDGTIPPEMHEKYLNIVVRETERLHKLTENLLTLNTYESRGNKLELTDFDMNEIIKNTAASFEGKCTDKKISLKLILVEEVKYVHADMSKIQQVLYNLLDNAIKFTPPNSYIYIETTEKYDKIYVSVKDTGVGISKEKLPNIWERFYKIDSSRGKDKTGTGLGLCIVKEIIQAHNETITVDSTEGAGTEFIFSLTKTGA